MFAAADGFAGGVGFEPTHEKGLADRKWEGVDELYQCVHRSAMSYASVSVRQSLDEARVTSRTRRVVTGRCILNRRRRSMIVYSSHLYAYLYIGSSSETPILNCRWTRFASILGVVLQGRVARE